MTSIAGGGDGHDDAPEESRPELYDETANAVVSDEDDDDDDQQPNTPGIRTPHDLASEIADLDDQFLNSHDITPDTASVDVRAKRSPVVAGQEIEEDTLPPEPGDEVVAEFERSEESSADQGPSVRSSPPSTPDSSRPASNLSIRSGQSPRRGPFEKRFQARKPSGTPPSLRNVSPALRSGHSRKISSSSNISTTSFEKDEDDELQRPWEVIKWTRLKKLSSQLFSETNKRTFGNRTFLAVGASILIGTSKGLILVFDYQQTLKSIIGQGTPAAECGSITALAISADHTTVAGGHANGFIFTWELGNASRPFLTIPAVPRKSLSERPYDTHVENHAVIHVGFLGTRHTALVSADDSGMAFSHLATRGLGALSRNVKSTRVLGRYPVPNQPLSKRPSSVLAFAPLPLGNVEQPTDDMGLTALITPYLLVIVSTTPIAQTQHKAPRSKQIPAHSPMTGCLAWFPAVRLKSPSSTPKKGLASDTSLTKLAYCWSTVLTILEIDMDPGEEPDEDKRPSLLFKQARHWKSEEAIVAVQWISRSVLAILTITQKLIILEDNRMRVSDTCDLNSRHIYHRDIFSKQLEPLVGNAEQEDTTMHGVIPDAYGMSFKAYKGRLFLLDSSDVTLGTLSNWADRLGALMELGQPLQAIQLATAYYAGYTDKVTVGLPEDDNARKNLLEDKLIDLVRDSLRYTFKMDETDELGKDIRTALQELIEPILEACLSMNAMTFLFDEIYEFYSDASCQDMFFYALEPQVLDENVTAIPPTILKDIVNWYYLMGMAPRLEAMICSLQTDSLDIDQVTGLCKEHFLYDALIYVWNTAVGDYVTPIINLLTLTRGINDRTDAAEQQTPEYESASKLFPYLALSLTGRKYPGGEELNARDADCAKAAIYGALFGGDELAIYSPSDADTGPYSALRGILAFDTPEFMSTMNEAFEDLFLNGPEEHYSNGEEHVSAGWSINRQSIVTILLQVLSDEQFSDLDRLYLDMFIARNVPKFQHQKFILLTGSTLHQILTELCACRDENLVDECQLSVEYLLSVYRPPDMQNFIPLFEQAGFYRVLKMTLKSSKQYAPWLQAHFADPDEQSAVFNAMIDCLKPSGGLSARQLKDIKAIIIEHAEHLAHVSVEQTASTLATYSTDILDPVFKKLSDDPELQYHFLRTLLEPADHRFDSAASFLACHRERYVQLMCAHNPSHVSDYVSTLDSGDLQLDSVIPVMESTNVIDAAVILMAKGGFAQDAIDRLVRHLDTFKTAVAGLAAKSLSEAHEEIEDVDDDNATHHALAELADQVAKFAKLGIWLCQGTPAGPHDGKLAAQRLRVEDMTEANLTAAERGWLALVSAVVDICRAADLPSEKTESAGDAEGEASVTATALRNTVQQVFTALLAATTSAQSNPRQPSTTPTPPPARLLPILRLFLTHLSRTQTLSRNKTIHPILQTLFQSYAFESFLLTLSLQLLNTDTFVAVEAAHAARNRGWRPAGRACAACGARVWGVGAGAEVWEAWASRRVDAEAGRRAAVPEEEGKGKGKSRARDEQPSAPGPARVDGDAAGAREGGTSKAGDAVVAFACGHIFHRTCLEDGMRARGRSGETDERGRAVFECLLCG